MRGLKKTSIQDKDGYRDSMTESAQWADSVKNIVFIQYLNASELLCFFFLYKNQKCKKLNIFHDSVEKIIKYLAKKSFSVFKGAVFGTFVHTKTLFGKLFYYFCYTYMKKI